MSPRNALESQPSVHAPRAGRPAAGCWKLVAGQALSLRPRQRSVLEMAQGRVWLTVSPARPWLRLPGAAADMDQVLQAGQRLTIEPGQHVVMEAWSPSGDRDDAGDAGAVAFRWDLAPASAGAASPASSVVPSRATNTTSAATDWDCGVVQPLRDLAHALGQGGRALGAAWAGVTTASGRFAAGLVRFALHRIAAPLSRRPA